MCFAESAYARICCRCKHNRKLPAVVLLPCLLSIDTKIEKEGKELVLHLCAGKGIG